MNIFRNKKAINFLWILWGIASVVVLLFVLFFPALMTQVTHFHGKVSYGEYGDIYGGLNTLFTGLAFVGLVVTIILQHQELKETRNEFKEQTKQFEKQTDILKEQLNEQKSFNIKQLNISLSNQNKEELLKRLDLIKNLQNDVRLQINKVQFISVNNYSCEYVKIIKGEEAFEIIFIILTDILAALTTKRTLSDYEKRVIDCSIRSLFLSLNGLNAWLHTINDYLRDSCDYFQETPNYIGIYYRMFFNSLTKFNEALLLINAGTTIPAQFIEICLQKEYISTRNVLSIHIDNKAREILFKLVNMDIKFDEARNEWQQYLKETGKEFDIYEFKIRTFS